MKAVELGYVISPAHRRRGYAAEAVEAVIQKLFEQGAELVTASAISRNQPSLNMLRKLGFRKEGSIHKGFWYPGEGAVDLESFYRERNK